MTLSTEPRAAPARWNDILVYASLLAGHVALLWLLPFLPTQDGANHLYNLVILRDLVHGTGGWEPYYTLNLHLAPNLGFTLLSYPLLAVLSPISTERMFLTIYVLLFGISVPAYLRAFGRPAFPLSYFAFIPIFSQPFMMGFYSEILGTPLLLLALAVNWRMRRRTAWARFLALNLAGFVLFVVHLIPFALYLLALGLLAILEPGGWRARVRTVGVFLLSAGPCLALAGVFYFRNDHQAPMPLRWIHNGPAVVLRDLAMFGEHSYSNWQYLPALALLPLVLLGLYQGLRAGPFFAADDEALVRRFSAALVLVLLALFLFAPDTLIGGSQLPRRLPPLILLFGLLLGRPWTLRFPPRRSSQVAAAMAAVTLLVNFGAMRQQSRKVEQFLMGLEAGLPRGAAILLTRADTATTPVPDALRHAPCYFGLQGAVDLGQSLQYEYSDPYFELRFRHPIEWEEIAATYLKPSAAARVPEVQFVLCWGQQPRCSAGLSPRFALDWSSSGSPLSIWRRQP